MNTLRKIQILLVLAAIAVLQLAWGQSAAKDTPEAEPISAIYDGFRDPQRVDDVIFEYMGEVSDNIFIA